MLYWLEVEVRLRAIWQSIWALDEQDNDMIHEP